MTYCHITGEEHKNNGAFFMLNKGSGKKKNEGHGGCSSLFKFVAV